MVYRKPLETGRRPSFVDSADIGALLRREGVDTTRLKTEEEVRAAIQGLSGEARDNIQSVLGQPRARDIEDLCSDGIDVSPVSER